LRVPKETELDAIARDDHGLARIGKIVSATDMSNPGQRKSAKRVQKTAAPVSDIAYQNKVEI
jgi:hypothetical protein